MPVKASGVLSVFLAGTAVGAVAAGAALGLCGFALTPALLGWLGTKEVLLDGAAWDGRPVCPGDGLRVYITLDGAPLITENCDISGYAANIQTCEYLKMRSLRGQLNKAKRENSDKDAVIKQLQEENERLRQEADSGWLKKIMKKT